jgi:hypothetical protein
VLLVFSGCWASRLSPPSLVGFRPLPPAEFESEKQALVQRAAELTSAQGYFESSLQQGLGRQSLKQIVVFERPGRMRIEFFASSLNQLSALIVAHDGLLEAFDPRERVLYRGEDSPRNIERVAQVPFRADELLLWFSGRVPYIESESRSMKILVNPRTSETAVVLDLSDGRRIQAVLDDSRPRRLLSLNLQKAGTKNNTFGSTFRYAEGSDIPQQIDFEIPEIKLHGELRVKQYAVNPDLSAAHDRLFRVRVNDSIRIEDLDHDTNIVFDPHNSE